MAKMRDAARRDGGLRRLSGRAAPIDRRIG
jgi:hypothetical protein